MRRILLILPLLFAFAATNAQYTILDEEGISLENGGVINIEVNQNQSTSEVKLYLTSETTDNIVFQVTNTTQPDGAQNIFCVGTHCYAPNFSQPATESLDGNEALLILDYKTNGTTESAVVDYKIYQEGDESVSFTFSIAYDNTTAIEDITTTRVLSAYPNPANSNVNISYDSHEDAQIILYNIVGNPVKKFDISAGSETLNIETSELSSGTYFYSISSQSGLTETKRLVIKH